MSDYKKFLLEDSLDDSSDSSSDFEISSQDLSQTLGSQDTYSESSSSLDMVLFLLTKILKKIENISKL